MSKKNNKIFLLLAVILVIALTAFAILFVGIASDRSYEKYMESANLAIANHDYDSALAALRKANSIDSTEESLLLMADCYEVTGNYEKALETLRQLNVSDPAIAARIASDEARRQSGTGDTVEINGSTYDRGTTSLVLDNRALGNSVIPEITQLYSLDNLSLANNKITDISGLSVLGGLTTLNIKDNQVTDISPLRTLTGLRTLYIDNNPITDLTPLYALSNLTFLSIKGIELKESDLAALSSALPNCTINGANATEEVQTISLGGVTFRMDIADPLDLSNRGITDISALSQCSNLTSINLSGNQIVDISPLMDIQYLTNLDISSNNISDIRPLMGLTGLKTLNAANNAIMSTVSLGANSALNELHLDNNPIGDFSGIRRLKNMITMTITNTGLKPTDIEYFTLLSKMLSLDIRDNPAITGEAYEQLQATIPKCEIIHSELVYTFSFGGANISSDQTALDLQNQGISDLSGLMQFTNLEYVNLSGNIISDLYYFSIAPSRTTIMNLNLSNNRIMDLSPLANMTNLQVLNLNNNNIYSVTPLYSLSNLRELHIGGNQLSPEQILELNTYLPNCVVVEDG